ncbi:hypothetical protein BDQ17DRAFT_1420099 [Cyathus striatus]|nr:hypothetical protein BDQ17DRAFT_1420099 [Cyathus striatus]
MSPQCHLCLVFHSPSHLPPTVSRLASDEWPLFIIPSPLPTSRLANDEHCFRDSNIMTTNAVSSSLLSSSPSLPPNTNHTTQPPPPSSCPASRQQRCHITQHLLFPPPCITTKMMMPASSQHCQRNATPQCQHPQYCLDVSPVTTTSPSPPSSCSRTTTTTCASPSLLHKDSGAAGRDSSMAHHSAPSPSPVWRQGDEEIAQHPTLPLPAMKTCTTAPTPMTTTTPPNAHNNNHDTSSIANAHNEDQEGDEDGAWQERRRSTYSEGSKVDSGRCPAPDGHNKEEDKRDIKGGVRQEGCSREDVRKDVEGGARQEGQRWGAHNNQHHHMQPQPLLTPILTRCHRRAIHS